MLEGEALKNELKLQACGQASLIMKAYRCMTVEFEVPKSKLASPLKYELYVGRGMIYEEVYTWVKTATNGFVHGDLPGTLRYTINDLEPGQFARIKVRARMDDSVNAKYWGPYAPKSEAFQTEWEDVSPHSRHLPIDFSSLLPGVFFELYTRLPFAYFMIAQNVLESTRVGELHHSHTERVAPLTH